jgi:hypothetical protein
MAPEVISMPTSPSHGGLNRLIRALRQVTMVCAAVGCCLFAGAFLLIPVLGFVSADIGAYGSWCLLLAALTASLLTAAIGVARARTGEWYFGERDLVTRFLTKHRTPVILVVAITLIGVTLITVWLRLP